MRKNRIIIFLQSAVLAIAFVAAGTSYAADPPVARKNLTPQELDYIIGQEDVLEVAIWKNAELSKIVNVRPDGKVSLPLIGDMQAAGLTPNQLRDAIVKKLKEYQETAVASVIVQSVNSYRIYVLGEVRTPGTYTLKSKTTVLQAIALAGGFTQFASKKIVLVRRKSDGSEEKIPVRFNDLVYDNDSDKDYTLKPGDTIFVP